MDIHVLFGGLVGALAVFFLGWFRETRKEKQELTGHLTLLSSEMKQNSIVLDAYRETPELMRRERAASLLNEAWLASRARTAQLAHPTIVAHLFSYHRLLGNARRLAEGWEVDDDPFVSRRSSLTSLSSP